MAVPIGYVKVNYTAGLEGGDDEYEEDLVPDWLREATINYASVVYYRLVENKNMDAETPKSQEALLDMPSNLSSSLAQHIRWFPTAQIPLHTNVNS